MMSLVLDLKRLVIVNAIGLSRFSIQEMLFGRISGLNLDATGLRRINRIENKNCHFQYESFDRFEVFLIESVWVPYTHSFIGAIKRCEGKLLKDHHFRLAAFY